MPGNPREHRQANQRSQWVKSQTDRNEPCPCGSGRKYKKCCLDRDTMRGREAYAPPGSFTPSERVSCLEKLMFFAYGPEFELDREIGMRLFWGDRLADRSEEDIRMVFELPQMEVNFNNWYLFDMDVEDGRTVADFFLRREGDRLGPGERVYLEKAAQTHYRLYEVQQVERDRGFSLRDLWTGDSYRVQERAATHSFVQWDLMVTRLMDVGAEEWVIDAGVYCFPQRAKEPLLRDLRKEHERFRRRCPGLDDVAFFKRFSILFQHWWLDRVVFRPLPQVVTVEGDDMTFTKVVFQVLDADRLKAALKERPEFEKTGRARYSWREELPEGFRSLGTLAVKGDSLVLETFSRERGRRGRSLLEAVAGETIKYRTSEHKTVEEALESAPKRRTPRRSGLPPELEAKLAKQFLDAHYHKWLDEGIPALDLKTPRHAVALKTYRPRVINLLKDMESMEARAAQAGRIFYDFG